MTIFKKKMKPQELLSKLKIIETRLEKRENKIQKGKEKARSKAKSAIKNGDDREFRVSSKRYGLLDSQERTISSMMEMTMSMSDVIEMHGNIGEIMDIGNILAEFQKDLGIDHDKMEKALANITSSIEMMNNSTELMTSTVDSIISSDVDASEAQEALKAELIAEISEEGDMEDELKKKIKNAQMK